MVAYCYYLPNYPFCIQHYCIIWLITGELWWCTYSSSCLSFEVNTERINDTSDAKIYFWNTKSGTDAVCEMLTLFSCILELGEGKDIVSLVKSFQEVLVFVIASLISYYLGSDDVTYRIETENTASINTTNIWVWRSNFDNPHSRAILWTILQVS